MFDGGKSYRDGSFDRVEWERCQGMKATTGVEDLISGIWPCHETFERSITQNAPHTIRPASDWQFPIRC